MEVLLCPFHLLHTLKNARAGWSGSCIELVTSQMWPLLSRERTHSDAQYILLSLLFYSTSLKRICRANDFPFSPETEAEFGV